MYAQGNTQRNNVLAFPRKFCRVSRTQNHALDNNQIAQMERLAESARLFAEQAGVLVRSTQRVVAALDAAQLALDRIAAEQSR